jgi:Lon-like protease
VRLRVLLALAAVVALVGVGQSWSVPYYALTPGDATNVAPLVRVQGLATDTHRDTIMLTDVYLSTLNFWQWLFMHFQSHVEFVPASALVDPGVPASQIQSQGYLEMADSKLAAEVAALRALGWRVPLASVGATVTSVLSSSPAFGHLQVGDRVVSVDGRPVLSACDLVGVVHDVAAGTLLRLGVDPVRISPEGVMTYGATRVLSVRTRANHGEAASACANVSGPARSYLGISNEDALRAQLPGRISITTSSIGGPSAGLAMTLALIDRLSGGSLTGHFVVAATGTMSASGQVGDVGGVAEKTVAVAKAGAQIFFVPQVEVPTATAVAPASLHVIGVTSLDQVLRDLRRLGGDAPVPLTAPH